MQTITPVTTDQLLAAGQEPRAKVEIYVSAAWVNLCDLGGKNYVEDWSISLGGASMTPNPITGTFSLVISNEDGIFHPDHPSSAYIDYFKAGRKVRISIGAEYSSTDYYWQRIIGYMEEPKFDVTGTKVNISGSDYIKLLEDTEFKSPDNYWGTTATFDSLPSDGLVGSEIYAEADAMDINSEADNVTNWTPTNCTFVSYADGGGGSTYVGRVTATQIEGSYIRNTNVGTLTSGKEYKIIIKYKRVGGSEYGMRVRFLQGAVNIGGKGGLSTNDWDTVTIYITAVSTAVLIMDFVFYDENQEFRIDEFSIQQFVSYWNRYYELPEASKGPYYLTLDGSPVWQGEEDEGWWHEESTRRVFFDINKVVSGGSSNLVVYYFTVESPENAVADILVTVGLYADRAAALAGMDYTATGITIDSIWFEAGSTCLNAIKKLCERCDYRFYFTYDGTPVFKPKPSGATAFTFTDQKYVGSINRFADKNEIKNRIVITGKKQAEPTNREDAIPSELKGEDSDSTSIDDYGERTLTIRNHLFQSQTPLDNMCTSLLAEYKDPKWYATLQAPYNPAPLEIGDKISWKERLSPAIEVTALGRIRDIKISKFNTTYVCEKET